jgi:hypothetical protein
VCVIILCYEWLRFRGSRGNLPIRIWKVLFLFFFSNCASGGTPLGKGRSFYEACGLTRRGINAVRRFWRISRADLSCDRIERNLGGGVGGSGRALEAFVCFFLRSAAFFRLAFFVASGRLFIIVD